MECFSMVRSRALLGLQAPEVTVEVHLTNGLPSFTLVGLADCVQKLITHITPNEINDLLALFRG